MSCITYRGGAKHYDRVLGKIGQEHLGTSMQASLLTEVISPIEDVVINP